MKKRMKKILALGLAVAMTCGMSATAMAAETTAPETAVTAEMDAQTGALETATEDSPETDATKEGDVDNTAVQDQSEAAEDASAVEDTTEEPVSDEAEAGDITTEDAAEGTIEAEDTASVLGTAPGNLNGLAPGEDGVWYAFRNGVVDSDIMETLMPYGGSWWYVSGGMIDFDYEGMCEYGGTDWYVKDGQVQFGYSGFVSVKDYYDYYGNPVYNWYYIHNGKVDTDYTDVVYASRDGVDGWYYIENGSLGHDHTIAHNVNGWWYIGDGVKVDFSYTGINSNENGWWYVKNGQVDFSYTDVYEDVDEYNGEVYVHQCYVKNGKLDESKTGVYWTAVNGQYGWHGYYEGSLANSDLEGMVLPNENGWWFVDGSTGSVDFSYTGIGYNDNGYWYVKNGQVDFSYNGFYTGEWRDGTLRGTNCTVKVVNGKVDENYTGVFLMDFNDQKNWYGFHNGWLSGYNVLPNENGWWYIEEDGSVDFSYNGMGENENGYWYIKNGQVDFGFTGTVQRTSDGGWTWYDYIENGKYSDYDRTDVVWTSVDGEEAWWYVSHGDISKTATTTVACNSNGWWYINDGKVDFSYNGIASNDNGTWYIRNGQVDFGYTGLVTVPTEYGNYYYYAENGKIDRDHNSVVLVNINGQEEWRQVGTDGMVSTIGGISGEIASNENGTWYCEDGKVDFSANGTKIIRETIFSWSGEYTVSFCYVLQVSNGLVIDVRVVNPDTIESY